MSYKSKILRKVCVVSIFESPFLQIVLVCVCLKDQKCFFSYEQCNQKWSWMNTLCLAVQSFLSAFLYVFFNRIMFFSFGIPGLSSGVYLGSIVSY